MQSQTAPYVLTTLVGSPPAGDLTTLETLKLELRAFETKDDTWMARAITQQSAAIARHCNRIFGLASWQDAFRPQRGIGGEGVRAALNPLVLARWPLVAVTSVVETIAGAATTLTAGTDYEYDQASLLPGDEGAGRLFRLSATGHPRTWPAALVVVNYEAGYVLPGAVAPAVPNLPGDVEDACLRLLTARFAARARDPLLMQRSQPGALGDERYWVGTVQGQNGAMPPEIAALLAPYRVPVTAAA